MVSSKNIRVALAFIVVIIVAGIVAAIAMKAREKAPTEPVSRQLPQNIDLALHNARFFEMREGKAVWELVAKRAEYDKNGDAAYLSDIKMSFFKDSRPDAITVTATNGTYDVKSRNVDLKGKVHVTTESGIVFDTESVVFSAETSKFTTPDLVRFNHNRLALTAVGMVMDIKKETVTFLKHIGATVITIKNP